MLQNVLLDPAPAAAAEGDAARRLREAGASGDIVAGSQAPGRNLKDWSTAVERRPLALARPRTTAEVASVVRACAELGLPIVPQGGMTGLCGGANPVSGSVALSLERLVGVEDVDPATATMVVRAGTPLQTIQEAADAAGLFCALDLGARGSCSIGGNLSTNAGGNRVVRYGMTRDMVLGVEVVLPDGTVVDSLNRLTKNNTGYDLKHLFIGAEGTLGVITRAVLKLFPKPRSVAAAFCGLRDFAAVLELLRSARSELGGTLSAFEVMWPAFYDLMTDHAAMVRRPLAGRHGIYVLLETHGADADADPHRLEALLSDLSSGGSIEDVVLAQSLGDVRGFWAVRDAVAEFDTLFGGPHVALDVSLPTGVMGEFVNEAEAAVREVYPSAHILSFGHLGDGNVHIVAHVPGRENAPTAEVQALVYEIVRRRQGSISAENGIGTSRLDYLGYSRTPAEIALMRKVKRALDPMGIMNPGKVLG